MLLERMVVRQSACLRRAGNGERAPEVGFGRFLANRKVTTQHLIRGWSEQTRDAVAGRHVLAIQDTTELNFRTTPERRRGLGKIGKGLGHGVLVHAMLAVDAANGSCLGLVAGDVYTRVGLVATPHYSRALKDKESRRWIDTPALAEAVLAQAAQVTAVSDREGDLYAGWATVPDGDFHLLVRMMHDRALADGGTVHAAANKLAFVATRTIDLLATRTRAARSAELSLRFSTFEVRRPLNKNLRHLPPIVTLRYVEVVERHPTAGVEPVHWQLLTTHAVDDIAMAWQIVDWYRRRWTIEQLFRLMKKQGLKIENSQLATAEGLVKLSAIATKVAAVTLQLVQARNGATAEPASNAFSDAEIAVLDALNAKRHGKTVLQQNPHPKHSLAWAAWIVARLGGWDGYPSSKPPGPITFRHGLEQFYAIATGWTLRDVCMP